MRRWLRLGVVASAIVAQAATGIVMAPRALAADKLGQVTEYPIPTSASNPTKLITGPNGNIWFAEDAGNKIGEVTTGGAFTEFPLPNPNSQPLDIAVGLDGNLWFTEAIGNRIGKMTTGGTLTEFPLPTANSLLDQITAGPDGNLWFTEQNTNQIGKITVAGVITEYLVPTAGGLTLDGGVGPGPDGNVWFTEGSGNKIGVITPAGLMTEFPIPTASSRPASIVPGPDGNMWFTEYNASKIGRILVGGAHTITEFPTPIANSLPNDLHAMADGNIWFSEAPGGQMKIARITTAGTIAEFSVATANSQPSGVTPGPDGNVWFSEYNANKIARIGIVPSPDLIGQITEFPLTGTGTFTTEIIAGADGNMWFTENTANKIGKVTTAGAITEFPLPNANSQPISIAAGSDGNLWFTEWQGNRIGRITFGGTITEFALPTTNSQPDDITAGPDGNIWFTESGGNKIGRITPTGTITEFTGLTASAQPGAGGIAAGSDGNLWFTEETANKIGRITPGGTNTITEFAVPTPVSRPNKIEPGPDGNLWFTEFNTNKIARITPGGSNTITEYTVPTAASGPNDLRAGPDGNMWFTEYNANINKVARITMTGWIAEFNVPTPNSQPGGIAPGPDGNMWFTENNANKIARIGVARGVSAESRQQYTLTASDGATWQPIDAAALSVTFTPKTNSVVVLSGNADLWTSINGVNQDLGIWVKGGIYGSNGVLVGWKESGGYAGTFSPNAAFVQVVDPFGAGAAYTATLVWKTNKQTSGTIYAAAGAGPTYSPTRLTAELIPQTDDWQTALSTSQYTLTGNDGTTWQDMDNANLLTINYTPAASGAALINANADLWTSIGGVNQDIGILISGGSFSPGKVVAWKESGGNAGTYSPNAADLQTVVQLTAGTAYTIKVQWKTNVSTPGTIYAAAGAGPDYSPTRLTLRLFPVATLVKDAPSTQQYSRTGSTGSDWMPIDSTNLQTTVTPTADSQWMLSGNVDLWTSTVGVNQDVGIFVSGGLYGTGTLVAWKESGGYAGTFSPNAAFVHTILPLAGGMTYTITLEWKANKVTGGTIYAAAGGGPIYSPTRLTAQSMG
jgi:streptogramin lyase